LSSAILADWDMRSGRNKELLLVAEGYILADWDMRSGRNRVSA